jgi:hypothetical protein
VTGTGLPTSGLTVSFGGVTCATSPAPTFSASQIQCTLAANPSAGSHKAEIRVDKGLLPYQSGVPDITIALEATSVSPTSVNPLGGAVITITGSGFPRKKDLISVTFSDDSICEILTLSETQITCRVVRFSDMSSTPRSVVITVQNIRYIQQRRELYSVVPTTNNQLSLTPLSNIPKVVSIDKTNVSPVLKQTLTFVLNSDYNDALRASDLKVKVINDAKNYSRDLFVMSVNDSAPKSFTVKFNGAPVGTYSFFVYANSDSQYGTLDTSAVTLTTSSTVTSISPTSGSIYGGTVLTITGSNFSSVISD